MRDAREHGVTVRPPDVNYSQWDSTLEPHQNGFAIRLGFRQISGLNRGAMDQFIARRDAPIRDIKTLQEMGLSAAHIRKLAEGDAMRSLFIDRRQALWDAKSLRDAPDLPLFQDTRDEGADLPVALPDMPVCEQVVADYQTLRLSLKAHPMGFLRGSMRKQGYAQCSDLMHSRPNQRIKLAGLVLIRQRPGSAKGVCFITIEDETGVANVVVWPKVMEQFRKTIMQSRLLAVHGYIQREGDIIHVIAQNLIDKSDAMLRLAPESMATPIARSDEVKRPIPAPSGRHPRNVQIIPKSRDFH